MNINLEIGFRFLPPDEQIISFFLKNKMIGDHKTTRHIREVDLLKYEPWQLPAVSLVQSTYPEWLFFYKLNKISEKKMDRLTNSGFWKSTGADRPVSYGGRQIGTKKTLVFYTGRTPSCVKTDWVMHEFRANSDFLPHNANNSYVVGYLRNNAAEKTENLISNVGQTSAHFAASSSPKDAVWFTSMEVVRQPQSESMDYEMALQMQMQMEDEGIFASDLSPSRGTHDLPPASVNNEQIMIEEGISFEDLDFLPPDALVDEEQNEWQLQFDTIEEEREFMDSFFSNQEEHTNVEAEHIYCLDYRATDYAGNRHDTDPKWDNAWCDQLVHMPDETHHGHSEGLNQKRMETGVHHDEILIMDSGVESATVTAYEINGLESVKEERSVISRACKPEPKSHKSVAQGYPRRVQLQGKSSGKVVSRDRTRESGIHSPVVQPVQNKKSVVQTNKSPKMDRDRNTKLVLNSRSEVSAGNSRKNSFNFVEMSQLRGKRNPPSVYVRNVIVGSILFIFVVWQVMFIR
ncbi:NAC domain containing 69-like protein isoform 1 [Hibiscus syriacus]|uniref:NAC domain containing 69-like protein isoform 1 n=1 Tax=Hibiscus syriacus TaxID=106335 RepID=A0A6A2XW67_HIBSY|nr:NAC domain-containing protein 91-like [Hibiscus syriacus]KAE8660547.1 NAC domain containing 69-like protein isoform 1 [Hibiscus syriacus]